MTVGYSIYGGKVYVYVTTYVLLLGATSVSNDDINGDGVYNLRNIMNLGNGL
jgi:hypothetical protein